MSDHCNQRFYTWIAQKIGGSTIGEVVVAELYDAAQAELAALREELSECKRDRDTEQRAAIEANKELKAADQRNADLLKAVEQSIEWFETMSSGDGSGHADLARAIRRIAKLNPPNREQANEQDNRNHNGIGGRVITRRR